MGTSNQLLLRAPIAASTAARPGPDRDAWKTDVALWRCRHGMARNRHLEKMG